MDSRTTSWPGSDTLFHNLRPETYNTFEPCGEGRTRVDEADLDRLAAQRLQTQQSLEFVSGVMLSSGIYARVQGFAACTSILEQLQEN